MLGMKQWESKMKGHMESDKDGETHQKIENTERAYCCLNNMKIIQDKKKSKNYWMCDQRESYCWNAWRFTNLPAKCVSFHVCGNAVSECVFSINRLLFCIKPHRGFPQVWRSCWRISKYRLLMRKITLSEFISAKITPVQCILLCMCSYSEKTEGFLARAYVRMHVRACMCFASCVFFIPPPGRPHAPSVSDWFSIHCHGEKERDGVRGRGECEEEEEEEEGRKRVILWSKSRKSQKDQQEDGKKEEEWTYLCKNEKIRVLMVLMLSRFHFHSWFSCLNRCSLHLPP